MDTSFDRLVIPQSVVEEMLAHARAESPQECCGILAGIVHDRVGEVRERYPVRNDLASPIRYATNPRDLLSVSRATRLAGWDWLAVYHSHPTSAAVPSRVDLAENTYGLSMCHVIVSLADAEPTIRAWWLRERDFLETKMVITENRVNNGRSGVDV